MSTSFNTQGLQDLLSFPFRSPGGKSKLLIAGLLSFAGFIIPIIPSVFVMGYGGLIARRILREKSEAQMPEWADLGEMFLLGLRLFGAIFVYSLPILFILVLSYAGMMVPLVTEALSHPSGSSDLGSAVGLQIGGMFAWMVGFGIAMLLSLVLWAILPVVLAHVAATNSFAAAFHFRDWGRILRANWGGFLVTMFLIGGVYIGTVLVAELFYMTIVLCILLPVVLGFIVACLTVISGAAFAQAYLEGVGKLEMPALEQSRPAEPGIA